MRLIDAFHLFSATKVVSVNITSLYATLMRFKCF